jgi:hypothetical protein
MELEDDSAPSSSVHSAGTIDEGSSVISSVASGARVGRDRGGSCGA